MELQSLQLRFHQIHLHQLPYFQLQWTVLLQLDYKLLQNKFDKQSNKPTIAAEIKGHKINIYGFIK